MKAKSYVLFIFFILSGTLQAQQASPSRADFLKMARYLASDSGKWTSPNQRYNPQNPRSAKSFGLWFKLKHREKLLHLTHVVYVGDTTRITGESYWLWHPGKQEIKYYSINFFGGFTEGESIHISDDKFTTSLRSYNKKGRIEMRKDENVIVSKNEHIITSSVFKNYKWEKAETYTFTKLEE